MMQLSQQFNLPDGGEIDAFFRFPEADFFYGHERIRRVQRVRGFVHDAERAFTERLQFGVPSLLRGRRRRHDDDDDDDDDDDGFLWRL